MKVPVNAMVHGVLCLPVVLPRSLFLIVQDSQDLVVLVAVVIGWYRSVDAVGTQTLLQNNSLHTL